MSGGSSDCWMGSRGMAFLMLMTVGRMRSGEMVVEGADINATRFGALAACGYRPAPAAACFVLPRAGSASSGERGTRRVAIACPRAMPVRGASASFLRM